MALKRISDLTAATLPLAGTELLELDDGAGGAFKTTAQDIADLAAAGAVTAFTDLSDAPAAYTGHASKLVRVNAGETALEFVTASGTGDVVGPASATANAIALFDGTTGKLIKDSTYTVTAAGAALLDDASASAQLTTLGGTTVGQAFFTLTNPGAIRFPQINADNTVTANTAAAQATALGLGTGNSPTFMDISVSDAAGNARDYQWSTSGSLRWIMRCTGTAESGSNAGSDFQLLARDDTGASLGTVFSVVRATQVVTFNQSPVVPTAAVNNNSTNAASTAYADRAAATLSQNSQSANYTLVAGDAGKHIYHPSTDANARTFTIPANASVAFPTGTTVTFVNETSQVVTIAITSDTLVLGGTGSTGSRSLAQYGVATALKVSSTRWIITGTGLT